MAENQIPTYQDGYQDGYNDLKNEIANLYIQIMDVGSVEFKKKIKEFVQKISVKNNEN